MDEVFYWLFNMSITASLAGVVVLCIRKIKAVPRRVIKILWVIPFIRLWIPFGITGKYGIMTLISRFTTKTVTVYELSKVSHLNFSMTNFAMAAKDYFPITYKTNILEGVFKVASRFWVVLFIAVFLTLVILYTMTALELKDAELFSEKNIYISEKVSSPVVFGVFRPKIILPVTYLSLEEEQLRLVLMHEKRHIKRCDNLFRLIAFATAALHWFNPFVWIFLNCFLADIELACDEGVLSEISESELKSYASVLVDCAENRNVFVSAFGGAKLRIRIENILSFKRISVLTAIIYGIFIIVIAYVILTNAPL